MTKKQIEELNYCIDLLLIEGKNTKLTVARKLNDMIKEDLENIKVKK